MQPFPLASIATKLRWIVSFAIFLALLLACVVFLAYDYYTSRAAKVEDIQTLAEVIGSNSTGALEFKDTGSAKEVLQALRFERDVTEACIYDRTGGLFVRYQIPGVPSQSLALAQTLNTSYCVRRRTDRDGLHSF